MKTVHDLLEESLKSYCNDDRTQAEIDGFIAGFTTAFDIVYQPNTYIYVPWPESQNYMDEKWFQEEAILADDSAYLIPLTRLATL